MNERQLKLKSILDRYSACTLTIEEAEAEIAEALATCQSVQKIADVHKYIPTAIKATVGNFELTYDAQDKSKFSCTIDGIETRNTKSIEIRIATNECPRIKMEFVPLKKKDPENNVGHSQNKDS